MDHWGTPYIYPPKLRHLLEQNELCSHRSAAEDEQTPVGISPAAIRPSVAAHGITHGGVRVGLSVTQCSCQSISWIALDLFSGLSYAHTCAFLRSRVTWKDTLLCVLCRFSLSIAFEGSSCNFFVGHGEYIEYSGIVRSVGLLEAPLKRYVLTYWGLAAPESLTPLHVISIKRRRALTRPPICSSRKPLLSATPSFRNRTTALPLHN